jgi:hypothetical protein
MLDPTVLLLFRGLLAAGVAIFVIGEAILVWLLFKKYIWIIPIVIFTNVATTWLLMN